MSLKYIFVILVSVLLLQLLESKEQQGAVELIVTKTINAVNQTNKMLGSGFKSLVDLGFKPLEAIGTKAEDGIIAVTQFVGKFIGSVSKLVKGAAMKFQNKEKKFIGCVKSQQFDPVKKIFMDISSCVTGKATTVNTIVEESLVEVNTTFGILKSLTMLPQCKGAKCLADYSSGIVGKIGKIVLGLASIGQKAATGIATIPVTLPVCLLSKPALSPVKVFGLLGTKIFKCVQA